MTDRIPTAKKRLRKESDEPLVAYYDALASRDSSRFNSLNIPTSTVFYVRYKIFVDTGVWYPITEVEKAMRLEGYTENA